MLTANFFVKSNIIKKSIFQGTNLLRGCITKVLVIVNIWACVMTEMVKTHQTQSSDQSRSSLLIGCFIRSACVH